MFNKKLFIFIICLLFFAGFLSFGFYYCQKSDMPKKESANQIGAMQETDSYYYEKAKVLSDYALCQKIVSNRAKNLCLQELALQELKSSICDLMDDVQLKQNCLGKINLKIAVDNNDLLKCRQIGEKMLKKACIEKLINYSDNINCELLENNELKFICLSGQYYYQAKKDNNSAVCDKITDGIKRANCLSELTGVSLHSDNDNDGLNFLQEHIYGADPDLTDTDGDGYLDGEEVVAGYNPKGEGKLLSQDFSSIISCDDIEDNELREICYFNSKINIINLYECDKISNNELYNYCVQELNVIQQQ